MMYDYHYQGRGEVISVLFQLVVVFGFGSVCYGCVERLARLFWVGWLVGWLVGSSVYSAHLGKEKVIIRERTCIGWCLVGIENNSSS